MKKLKFNRLPFLKSIALWSLFSIAMLRGLALFEITPYLLYLFIPGCLFSIFLIYYKLKTKTFLNYTEFLFSIFIISCISHLFNLFADTFIQISYIEDHLPRVLIMFAASLVVSSVLYLMSLTIKRART